MISAQEYQQRRERFMANLGNNVAIFRSAPTAVMHHDVEYPYRQDSDFYYLTGFNEAEAVAVFAPQQKKYRFLLFVQPRDPAKETWNGYRVGVEGAQSQYGADRAYAIKDLDKILEKYLKPAAALYYRFGRDAGFNQRIVQHWQQQLKGYAKNGSAPTSLCDPSPLLHEMRLHKSPAELALMRKAISISAQAHATARQVAQPGVYEYQVQAALEQVFREQGGDGAAYPSIVAAGEQACILHYIENNRKIQDGELLLIDAGCACGYYNADITRTFPVNGRFSAAQQALYRLVLSAQQAAIAQVKPGNRLQQVHDAAVRVLTEGLLELGLLSGEPDPLIRQKAYRPYYMHGTSHWLGLDVHDAGTYKQQGKSQVLRPGMVLTVEPGLYIGRLTKPAPGQPDIQPHWRNIGIRIEDDLLVTPDGHEVLSAAVPKSLAALEN